MSAERPNEWSCLPLIQKTAEYFSGKGIPSPRLDAELLLQHVTKLTRLELFTRLEYVIRDPELTHFRDLVRRRAAGEPVAYLTGMKEFWSLPFFVNHDVLIPRPETESLVDAALSFCRTISAPLRVLDIGTGSGCIAISLAHELSDAVFVATDISADAITVAERNATHHHVDDRISFREGSVYAPVTGERFQCVVSNPPYIAIDDNGVEAGVRAYEPHGALFAGEDGLTIFRELARGLDTVLDKDGAAFFEIGAGQAEAVCALFRAQGFDGCRAIPDLAGLLRVVRVTRHKLADDGVLPEMRVEPIVDAVAMKDDALLNQPQAEDAHVKNDSAISVKDVDDLNGDDSAPHVFLEPVLDPDTERMLDAYGEGGDDEPEESSDFEQDKEEA